MKARRLLFFSASIAVAARAGDLDTTGFTSLRALHPELTGAGVSIAHVEAEETANSGKYQVNPSAVGLSSSLFKYYDSTHLYGGAGASFSSSRESSHADHVGQNFYGAATGGAPGVSLVENFDAAYFINGVIGHASGGFWAPIEINSRIVNQSFTFSTDNNNAYRAFYDAYANEFGTLFITPALSSDAALSTSYNGIHVAPLGGGLSGGIQLLAPGGATSFTLPYVSAAAAVLEQAADLGYFGARVGTNPADSRVVKAGLLNGATKTAGWSQTSTTPLDPAAGTGVVNVQGAFDTLSGGQKNRSSTQFTSLGGIPTSAAFQSPVGGLSGWDLNTLAATGSADIVAHYFFDLSSQLSLSLDATLTWNSIVVGIGANDDFISNFDLVLVDSITHAIIWNSLSTAYNVEHIHVANLSGSKYDLQVILRGGSSAPVLTDDYAVAWKWESSGVAPVPESDAVWLIGAMGALFVLRRRRAA